MKVKSAVLAVIVACTTGCSAVVRPSAAEITNTKHVEDKNYALGVSAEAHVGDAMVRVRDYFVTRRTAPTAAPSADMVISGGPVTIPLTKGQALPVTGTTVLDGNTYTVVTLKYPSGEHGLLIDRDGRVHNRILNSLMGYGNRNVVMAYTFKTTPSDAKFIRGETESVDTKAGYTNYELIYTGRDKESIHLSYREFTPENMARAAFFQNLTYAANSNIIRFRNLRIEVASVDNEKISYRVIDD